MTHLKVQCPARAMSVISSCDAMHCTNHPKLIPNKKGTSLEDQSTKGHTVSGVKEGDSGSHGSASGTGGSRGKGGGANSGSGNSGE